MLRYWNRIITMPNDKLTKHIFNHVYMLEKSKLNWISYIKEIFVSLGMEDVFASRTKCNLDICKEEIVKKAQEEWKLFANSKPKLRTYITFKDQLETDYVKTDLVGLTDHCLQNFVVVYYSYTWKVADLTKPNYKNDCVRFATNIVLKMNSTFCVYAQSMLLNDSTYLDL